MQQLDYKFEKLQDLQIAFRKEMPLISEDSFTYPKKFGMNCMPKNLNEDYTKVNEKFLDKWLGTIQENLNKYDLELFNQYQNKYFSKNQYSENLKESFFRKCKCKTSRQLRDVILQSMGLSQLGIAGIKLDHYDFLGNIFMGNHGNAFLSFGDVCTPGADNETGDTGLNATGWSGQNVGTKHTITKNTCFDRVAFNISAAVGNMLIGIYDNGGADTGNTATNLLGATTAHAAVIGFNWKTLTEVTAPDSIAWVVENSDSVSLRLYYNSTGVRSAKNPVTYPTLQDPTNTWSYPTTFITNNKMGHS